MACHIDYLPDEILEYILNLVPPYKDLKECMFVCKRWYHAVKLVIEHKEVHFQRSVADGSLLWDALPLETSTPTISKRHSHSACAYENSMYIFGGCTRTGTTFNDLWKLDLATRKWERPIPIGCYPSPKACASMVYYDKSFILFGGWAHPPSYPLFQMRKLFSELHIYSIVSNKWTAIETIDSPPPICAHSATVHGNTMVVFGGMRDFFNPSNEVWCLDLINHSWHKQPTANPKPQRRYGHSQIALDDKHLLILGGCTGPNVGIDDVWLLKLEGPSWEWTKIKVNGSEFAPMMIWCHQACKVGDNIIILSKKKLKNQGKETSSCEKVMCNGPVSLAVDNYRCPARANNIPVPNRAYEIASEYYNQPLYRRRNLPSSSNDRDEHVNGNRGRLTARRNVFVHNDRNHIPFQEPQLGGGLPVDKITVAKAAMKIIRRKLITSISDIHKISEEYRKQCNEQRRISSRLAIFVLNIKKVLCTEHEATWTKPSESVYRGPEERVLYSFVLGKGELIFFGGMRKYPVQNGSDVESDPSEVFNDVYFLNPPPNLI